MPEVKHRFYKCKNCRHVQQIQTNHEGDVIDNCKNCSWKPSFGRGKAIPFNGRTYREFTIATARDLPKPRKGSCFVFHGDDWSWSPLEEWKKTQYLARHGREIYVGERALQPNKLYNIWLSYAKGGSGGGPRDLYIAQLKRKSA